MSALLKPVRVAPAPKGAGLLLAALVPIEIATAFLAAAAAVLVVPLIDVTPIIAIATARGARRWEGATPRLFRAITWISVAMLAEWALYWILVATNGFDLSGSGFAQSVGAVFGFLMTAYPFELAILFALTGVACAMTYAGVRRTRVDAVPAASS